MISGGGDNDNGDALHKRWIYQYAYTSQFLYMYPIIIAVDEFAGSFHKTLY